MITIYLTPENGEGVLTNGGIIRRARVDENSLKFNPTIQARYHGGYGGEGTWWHTSLLEARKVVNECKKNKILLLERQIANIRKLPITTKDLS